MKNSTSLSTAQSSRKNIAVIGAGYTGLTVAYRLATKGYKVSLYERSNLLGGLVAGFDLDGIPLERAYHFLYTTDKEAIDLAKELNVYDDLTFHDSSISTYYGGKVYPFMTPLDLLKFTPLSIIDRVRTGLVGLYLQKLTNWKPLTEITALEWLMRYNGKRATEIIWTPLLKGKFDKYYDKVTMSWLWSRIHVRANSKETTQEKLGYFKGGFRVQTEAMSRAIEKAGGTIYLESDIQKITPTDENHDGRIRIVTKDDHSTQSFDDVVATTPSHVLAQLTQDHPGMTDDYRTKLTSIDYIGAVVMTFSTTQEISDYYWHNINDDDVPFLVLLSKTALSGLESTGGKYVYYIGDYVTHDHRYFSTPKEEIMQEWKDGLQKMFAHFDQEKIVSEELFTFRNAQHIVDIGYEDKMPAYQTPIPGLYLANFSQIYPDDRGVNYAIKEGEMIAQMVMDEA
jgi:protoporphyrinogen oxidase